jgi:hypothetical protein
MLCTINECSSSKVCSLATGRAGGQFFSADKHIKRVVLDPRRVRFDDRHIDPRIGTAVKLGNIE